MNNFTSSQKENILHEQAATVGFKSVGKKKYSTATIVLALCYFALSKSAYGKFCQDFKLLSVLTFTRLASSAKRYDGATYYSNPVVPNLFAPVGHSKITYITLDH